MNRTAFIASAAMATMLLACTPPGGREGGNAADDAAPAITKRIVNLDANGISIPPQDGDAELVVPFGSLRAATEDTLSAALGSIKDRQANGDCPAGAISSTRYEGIMLNFQKDKFVGWYADGGDYLPTPSRAELTGDRDDVLPVEKSTLGAEYVIGTDAAGTISLLFADGTDSAKPTAMWAGVNCIFR